MKTRACESPPGTPLSESLYESYSDNVPETPAPPVITTEQVPLDRANACCFTAEDEQRFAHMTARWARGGELRTNRARTTRRRRAPARRRYTRRPAYRRRTTYRYRPRYRARRRYRNYRY